MIIPNPKVSQPYRSMPEHHRDPYMTLYDRFHFGRDVVEVFYDMTDAYVWRVRVAERPYRGMEKWIDCEGGYGSADIAIMDALEYLGWTPPAKP